MKDSKLSPKNPTILKTKTKNILSVFVREKSEKAFKKYLSQRIINMMEPNRPPKSPA